MVAASGNAFTILIDTGVHAGTVQRLAPGLYTLGSALDADIVLSDPGIEPLHAVLELDHRGLRLEPLNGSIAIAGETTPLAPGDQRHLSAPLSFTAGEAGIKISAPRDSAMTGRRKRAGLAAFSLALLGGIGVQLAAPFADTPDDGSVIATSPSPAVIDPSAGGTPPGVPVSTEWSARPDTPPSPAEPDMAGAKGETQAPAPITLDQAADRLRARLLAAGLDDIQVSASDDRVLAKGEIPASKMAGWQDVRMGFDSTFGQTVLLVADVEPAKPKAPPKLAIEAVWSGDEPYLIAGGRRFFVGAAVGDGWTIQRIDAGRITFRRGQASYSLTL